MQRQLFKFSSNNASLLILSILIFALTIRSIGIFSRPIWYDEAFAILFAEKGPNAMVYGTLTPTEAGAADIHPLGYYTLLWAWMQAFGQSLLAVRILSVLAGVATVFFAYMVAKELFEHRIALIAALFVALEPFHIHYSQEIRMYSFLALWLMIATYAYLRGSKHNSWFWWVLFSIVSALAQYTHNLAVIYLVPLAISPLFKRDRKTLLAVTLAGLGAVLLYLPWLIQLPSQFSKVSNAYWVERPGLEKLFTLFLIYVTNLPVPDGWLFPALFIAMAVISIGTAQTFRASNRNPSGFWLFYLSFAPPVLLFLVSQWVPIYIERALLPSGVIFCVWLAWAIFGTTIPKVFRSILVGLLLIGMALGIFQHVSYHGFPYAAYKELGESLRSQAVPGDTIVHSNKLTIIPVLYFDRSLPQIYVADPPGAGTDTLAEATREILKLNSAPNIEAATSNANRIWFIIFKRSIQEYQLVGAKTHPHLEYLDQNLIQVDVIDRDGLQVFLYEHRP